MAVGDWPSCAGCGGTAACYGQYEEEDAPSYACNDCCDHTNEDGWCKPVQVLPEDNDTEPGPADGDLVCACGCNGAALYMCYTGDTDDLPACMVSMKSQADDARLFDERFRAKPFPKPLAYSMADYVRSLPR